VKGGPPDRTSSREKACGRGKGGTSCLDEKRGKWRRLVLKFVGTDWRRISLRREKREMKILEKRRKLQKKRGGKKRKPSAEFFRTVSTGQGNPKKKSGDGGDEGSPAIS